MKKPHIRKMGMFWEVVWPAQPDTFAGYGQWEWIPAWCMTIDDVKAQCERMSKYMPTWSLAGEVSKTFGANLPSSIRA